MRDGDRIEPSTAPTQAKPYVKTHWPNTPQMPEASSSNQNFDPAELIVSADDSIFGQGDTTKPREYDPSFGSITSGGGAAIQIKRITDADIEKLQKVEGVESVREDISVNLRYVTREGQKKFVATASQFNPSQKPDLLAGQLAQPFEGKKVILPEGFLEPLGFTSAEAAVGKKITFAIPRSVTPD